MLRNFRLYRLQGTWPESEDKACEALKQYAFVECNRFSRKSAGFEQSVEQVADSYCRRISGLDFIKLRFQTKLLPDSVVSEALEERVGEFSSRTGELPTKGERKSLKDETISKLLPQAMTKSKRLLGVICRKRGLLILGSVVEGENEVFLEKLNAAVPGLLPRLIEFKEPLESFMKKIILDESIHPFRVGRECKLREIGATNSTISWFDRNLKESHVRESLLEGLTIDRVEVRHHQNLTLVIDRKYGFLKCKLLGETDAVPGDSVDLTEKTDGDFALIGPSLLAFFDDFSAQLGGMV